MSGASAAQSVAVVRFGSPVGAAVARAALRKQWSVLEGDEPGVVRGILFNRTRVMVVQLDSASAEAVSAAFSLIRRLARHFNPVRTVVVGPSAGEDYEREARCAGAAAYVPAGVSPEMIENITDQLLQNGSSGTLVADRDLSAGLKPPSNGPNARLRRA